MIEIVSGVFLYMDHFLCDYDSSSLVSSSSSSTTQRDCTYWMTWNGHDHCVRQHAPDVLLACNRLFVGNVWRRSWIYFSAAASFSLSRLRGIHQNPHPPTPLQQPLTHPNITTSYISTPSHHCDEENNRGESIDLSRTTCIPSSA
jgi:hypothetical protein